MNQPKIRTWGMALATCCSLLALLIGTGCKEERHPAVPTVVATGPQELVWPQGAAYTGAYVDFGEGEDKVTLEAIEQFDSLVGKKQAIIASSSFWGEQTFPGKNIGIISRYGAVPLIFWSPWDRPYMEHTPEKRFSLESILAGSWDKYIDQWADNAKAFGKPLLVAWGIEMNGEWFPWSGAHHGAGEIIPGSNPIRYRGPEAFKQAYRYVVDRVRARGANNVLWGFHVNHVTYPRGPWNTMASYYPGDDYVDWLGMSAYSMQYSYQGWCSLTDVTDDAYKELAAVSATKPMVMAEWGVGEFPKAGNKGVWMTDAFAALKNRYPRFRAAVYWHERWQNSDQSYSNLRVNSSPESLNAYREAVADPYWLPRPLFLPKH